MLERAPLIPAPLFLPRTTRPLCLMMLALAAALVAEPARAATILFDATKHEMAGNADWVIDSDLWNLNMPAYPCTGSTNESNPQRIPTPPQSGIGPSTLESYWKGGISAWAVDLVKAGHTVETLPNGGLITYGDGTNPQDLSNYQLFIVVEPQGPFSAAEKTAILAFVNAGGGLFMVADHETSDRDCDGWDSPHVWNDLGGATSASSTGLFGIWFRVNGLSDQGSEDWFNDGINSNTETSGSDPIIHGPFGSGAGGLGLFGSTSMELNPADNPSATAHVWRTGQPHDNSRVTFATALYGNGRVAAIGDSSPADDSSGDTGDTLYGGWTLATGGVNNREIHLNACHWLMNAPPPPIDTIPPAAVTDLKATPVSNVSVSLTWTASGDDGVAGTASAYDIRMSPARILTTADFAGATPVPGAPTPRAAGASEQLTVSGLTADTAYYFALRVADEVPNDSSLSNCDGAVTAPTGGGPSPTNHLVISQFQVAGDGTTPADDEFIELYNPTTASVPLGGLSVQYKAATGTTYLPFALPATTIPAQGWYLLARSVYNGSPAADATYTNFLMAGAGGNLFLVNGTTALSGSCSTSASIIDKVAYGTGNCPETAAAAAPTANNSALRKPGGASGSGQDTNDNGSDFQSQVPSAPHNRTSAPATPPASLGNVGNTLFLKPVPDGVFLDWANAAGATAYRAYRGTVPSFMSGSPAPWANPTASQSGDAAIPSPGTCFFYIIRATDGINESAG